MPTIKSTRVKALPSGGIATQFIPFSGRRLSLVAFLVLIGFLGIFRIRNNQLSDLQEFNSNISSKDNVYFNNNTKEITESVAAAEREIMVLKGEEEPSVTNSSFLQQNSQVSDTSNSLSKITESGIVTTGSDETETTDETTDESTDVTTDESTDESTDVTTTNITSLQDAYAAIIDESHKNTSEAVGNTGGIPEVEFPSNTSVADGYTSGNPLLESANNTSEVTGDNSPPVSSATILIQANESNQEDQAAVSFEQLVKQEDEQKNKSLDEALDEEVVNTTNRVDPLPLEFSKVNGIVVNTSSENDESNRHESTTNRGIDTNFVESVDVPFLLNDDSQNDSESVLRYRRVCASVGLKSIICMYLRYPFPVSLQQTTDPTIRYPSPVEPKFYELDKSNVIIVTLETWLNDCNQTTDNDIIVNNESRVRVCLDLVAVNGASKRSDNKEPVVALWTRSTTIVTKFAKDVNNKEDTIGSSAPPNSRITYFHGTGHKSAVQNVYRYFGSNHQILAMGASPTHKIVYGLLEMFGTCVPTGVHLTIYPNFNCHNPFSNIGSGNNRRVLRKERASWDSLDEEHINIGLTDYRIKNKRLLPETVLDKIQSHLKRNETYFKSGNANTTAQSLRPLTVIVEYPFAHVQDQDHILNYYDVIENLQKDLPARFMDLISDHGKQELASNRGYNITNMILYDGMPQFFPTETSGFLKEFFGLFFANNYTNKVYGTDCVGPLPQNSLLKQVNELSRESFLTSSPSHSFNPQQWYGRTWEFANQFWWQYKGVLNNKLDCTHPLDGKDGANGVHRFFLQAMIDDLFDSSDSESTTFMETDSETTELVSVSSMNDTSHNYSLAGGNTRDEELIQVPSTILDSASSDSEKQATITVTRNESHEEDQPQEEKIHKVQVPTELTDPVKTIFSESGKMNGILANKNNENDENNISEATFILDGDTNIVESVDVPFMIDDSLNDTGSLLRYRRVCTNVGLKSILCMYLRYPFPVPLQQTTDPTIRYPSPVEPKFYELDKSNAVFVTLDMWLTECSQTGDDTIVVNRENRVRLCLDIVAVERGSKRSDKEPVVALWTRSTSIITEPKEDDSTESTTTKSSREDNKRVTYFHGTGHKSAVQNVYRYFGNNHQILAIGASPTHKIVHSIIEMFGTCVPTGVHLQFFPNFNCKNPYSNGDGRRNLRKTPASWETLDEEHINIGYMDYRIKNKGLLPETVLESIQNHLKRNEAYFKSDIANATTQSLRPLTILVEYPFAHVQDQDYIINFYHIIEKLQKDLPARFLDVMSDQCKQVLATSRGYNITNLILYDGLPQFFPTETNGFLREFYRPFFANNYTNKQYGTECVGPLPQNSLLKQVNELSRESFLNSSWSPSFNPQQWYGRTWEFANQFWWQFRGVWNNKLDCTHPVDGKDGVNGIHGFFLQAMIDDYYENTYKE